MVKPFADAVFDECKAVGDVVGPVKSQFGFHVVKLTGIGGATKPFDEVKAQVRQTLMYKDPAMADKAKAPLRRRGKGHPGRLGRGHAQGRSRQVQPPGGPGDQPLRQG